MYRPSVVSELMLNVTRNYINYKGAIQVGTEKRSEFVSSDDANEAIIRRSLQNVRRNM